MKKTKCKNCINYEKYDFGRFVMICEHYAEAYTKDEFYCGRFEDKNKPPPIKGRERRKDYKPNLMQKLFGQYYLGIPLLIIIIAVIIAKFTN